MVQLQNELARLEVDILHTQGHNVRLEQAMQLLNEDINEKMQTIGKYEARLFPLQLCSTTSCACQAFVCKMPLIGLSMHKLPQTAASQGGMLKAYDCPPHAML